MSEFWDHHPDIGLCSTLEADKCRNHGECTCHTSIFAEARRQGLIKNFTPVWRNGERTAIDDCPLHKPFSDHPFSDEDYHPYDGDELDQLLAEKYHIGWDSPFSDPVGDIKAYIGKRLVNNPLQAGIITNLQTGSITNSKINVTKTAKSFGKSLAAAQAANMNFNVALTEQMCKVFGLPAPVTQSAITGSQSAATITEIAHEPAGHTDTDGEAGSVLRNRLERRHGGRKGLPTRHDKGGSATRGSADPPQLRGPARRAWWRRAGRGAIRSRTRRGS